MSAQILQQVQDERGEDANLRIELALY